MILAVRDTAGKGEAAAKRLKEELPSWTGKVDVWKLDMSSFASVKEFGERLNTLERLDILILSAGVSCNLLRSRSRPAVFSARG